MSKAAFKAHVIEGGRVVNTILVEALDALPGMQLVDGENGGAIGDIYDAQAGTFTTPVIEPPAPEVPLEVSRRRGLRALFEMYGLKEADIEAAIIDAITDDAHQYVALSEFRTSQTFERNRALVVMMGVMLNLDLDALFIYAAKLP